MAKDQPKHADGWGLQPSLSTEPLDHYYRGGVPVAQIVNEHGAYQCFTLGHPHHIFGSARTPLGRAVATWDAAKAVIEQWIKETGSPALSGAKKEPVNHPPTEPVDSGKKK